MIHHLYGDRDNMANNSTDVGGPESDDGQSCFRLSTKLNGDSLVFWRNWLL